MTSHQKISTLYPFPTRSVECLTPDSDLSRRWVENCFQHFVGHYDYLLMPFGLTNVPTIYQALVNNILCNMLNQFIFVFETIGGSLLARSNSPEAPSLCLLQSGAFPSRGECTMLEIRNCLWLFWHFRKGDTGWRVRPNCSWSGRTLRTCPIEKG